MRARGASRSARTLPGRAPGSRPGSGPPQPRRRSCPGRPAGGPRAWSRRRAAARAHPVGLEHLVRLEVEPGLEERGRFREADPPPRVGGRDGPVRERAGGAGRALGEGGRVGAPVRPDAPAVDVPTEEIDGKLLGGRRGRFERARIRAHRRDRLESAPRALVVERVENEIGEPVPQGQRQRHGLRGRRPARRRCAARICSRWFRSCSAQWSSICGIVSRPYSGCRPCCRLCAALSRPPAHSPRPGRRDTSRRGTGRRARARRAGARRRAAARRVVARRTCAARHIGQIAKEASFR
jgi:hypothetical protein